MEKLILILAIIGVIFLAGSCSARAVDISVGPRAEGQRSLDEAQAKQIEAQAETGQAQAAEELRDEQLVNDATREARVRTAKIIQWVLGIAGGLALAFAIVMAAVNVVAFMGIVNFRFAVMPIPVRSGPQVGWVLPVVPQVLYLTSDDAPLVIGKLEAGKAPQLVEPYDEVGLSLASALKEKARNPSYGSPGDSGFAHAVQLLSDILNGRRQLRSSSAE